MLWSCFSFITEACNVIQWFGSLQFPVVHMTNITCFAPVCLVMWQIAWEMQNSYLVWQGDSLQGKLATNEFSELFTLKTTGRMASIYNRNPYARLSLNQRPWVLMFLSHALLHVNHLAFSVWQMLFSWRLAQVPRARREQRRNCSSRQTMRKYNFGFPCDLNSANLSSSLVTLLLPLERWKKQQQPTMHRCIFPLCLHPVEVCRTTTALCYDNLCWRTRPSLSPELYSSSHFHHCAFLGLLMFFSAGSSEASSTRALTLPPLPPTSSTDGAIPRKC